MKTNELRWEGDIVVGRIAETAKRLQDYLQVSWSTSSFTKLISEKADFEFKILRSVTDNEW